MSQNHPGRPDTDRPVAEGTGPDEADLHDDWIGTPDAEGEAAPDDERFDAG